MKKKQFRKLMRRVDAIEGRLADMVGQEKRIVDLIVGLTTEHVGRLLRESAGDVDERRIVDAISRNVTQSVQRVIEDTRIDGERMAQEIAQAVAQART